MIEVLVALLILGVGLMGLAGMQAHSLRSNYSAYLRSQATFSVYEIIDRMRANRIYAKDNQGYNVGFGESVSGGTCSSACSPAAMSSADLSQWLAMVERLPGGEGQVNVNGTTGVAVVEVRWIDRNTGGEPEYLKFTARSQL